MLAYRQALASFSVKKTLTLFKHKWGDVSCIVILLLSQLFMGHPDFVKASPNQIDVTH